MERYPITLVKNMRDEAGFELRFMCLSLGILHSLSVPQFPQL